MIIIFEHQHEQENPDNFQERTITYSDFDSYCEDLKNDSIKHMYPSLPRKTKVLDYYRKGNEVILVFDHRVTQKRIEHRAHVVI